MCFTEFIGYTCGHTSVEVLRPCPLTTQFHANPICAAYGRRPILAMEMCPACHRILHGRSVVILEWEHHWMHERGVCGCNVIFPDLIKPRIIVRSYPTSSTQPSNQPVPVANNTVEKSGNKNKNKGKAKMASAKKTLANNNGRSKTKKRPTGLPDAPQTDSKNKTVEISADKMQLGSDQTGEKQPSVHGEGTSSSSSKADLGESQQGDATGQDIPAAAPVRIHSLFGAEWIDEHHQLHNAGSCKCEADFSYYQTPEMYGSTESSSLDLYNGQEQAVPRAGSHCPYFQDAQSWGQGLDYSSHPAQASYEGWSEGPQPGYQSQAYQPYHSYEPYFPTGQSSHRYQGAQPGQWSTAQQQPGLPANIGQPVRSSGGIYQVDPAKSTNPLYNFACTEGGKQGGRAGRCVDIQGLDYTKAKDAPPPLVGLPIGAGPESPVYLEHIGSFQDCVLNQRNKGEQSRQAPQAQALARSQEAAELHQDTEPGQTVDSAHIVGRLLAEANDTRSTRLARLTHKKSASATYTRLSWDECLHGTQPSSSHTPSVHSNNGSGSDEEDF